MEGEEGMRGRDEMNEERKEDIGRILVFTAASNHRLSVNGFIVRVEHA